MAYDKPCRYCGETVYIRNNHVRSIDNKLAHISCHEDHNSRKSFCVSCGGEIIILRSYVVTESLRIKKDGTLAKKSHKTDKNGEGTESLNALCESCGEEYKFKVSNGIYTILGKSY